MNEQEYIAYFEAIAQEHIDIADDPAQKLRGFALMDEALNGLKSGIEHSRFILVIRNEEGQAVQIANANLVESHTCGFLVLRKCRPGDYPAIREAHQQGLQVARDIISRMVLDRSQAHPLMKFLDLEKISFRKEGPYYDSFYGYEINFGISAKAGCLYKFNEAKWRQSP